MDEQQVARPACVVLAHDAPRQLHRLVAALDPLEVFLAVDARTPPAVLDAMTDGLPARVRLVTPRVATPWATFGAVAAELAAYRQVLAQSSATHVVWMSGSDYPLVSTADLVGVLTPLLGSSVADFRPLPIPYWGMSGGLGRLRYYHWAWRRHVVRLPVPRRLPAGLVPAGGPVQKILARHHVQALLDAVHARPELPRFWRRAWAPDETFTATVMSSPSLVPDWADHHVHDLVWQIDWRAKGITGPPVLGLDALPFVQEGRLPGESGLPRLFARKFDADVSAALLDRIDELRAQPLPR